MAAGQKVLIALGQLHVINFTKRLKHKRKRVKIGYIRISNFCVEKG